MHLTFRLLTGFVSLLVVSPNPSFVVAEEDVFSARQKSIKQRFEENQGKPRNKAVHGPPMIQGQASELGDDEPVIGVRVNDEARAYPLVMLFGGGGIFELLNDTCGKQPIAVSW